MRPVTGRPAPAPKPVAFQRESEPVKGIPDSRRRACARLPRRAIVIRETMTPSARPKASPRTENRVPEAVFDTLACTRRLKEGVATKADLALLEAKIERGVNRTLLAVTAVGGVVVAAVIASAFAVIDRLP